MKKKRVFAKRMGWLTLGLVAVLVVTSYLVWKKTDGVEGLGYVGAFVSMYLANATLAVPLPGFVPLVAMSQDYNLWGLIMAGGLGSASGEMVAYMAGQGGGMLLDKKSKKYKKVKRWMDKWGYLAIFCLSMIPNPLTDVATTIAGASKLSWWRVWLVLIMGKIINTAYLVGLGVGLWEVLVGW